MSVPPRWRHVAVTGASSGIGAALAQAHAGAGVRLALAGRNHVRLAAVADTCRAKGAQVETTIFDVRQPDRVRDWIVATDARLPLDLVYANAGLGGTYALAGPQGEDGEAARAIVETNLIGVINTAGPALEVFLARGQGHLVLIGSLAGRLAFPIARPIPPPRRRWPPMRMPCGVCRGAGAFRSRSSSPASCARPCWTACPAAT